MTVTLTKPGDEVTMLVKTVATIESTAKAGTFRYQIDGTLGNGNEERVYLNTPVVDKQLSHLQLAEATDLIGSWYRFYRIAAPNNTPAAGYLNIDTANKSDATPVASKRVASPLDTRTAGQREFDAAVPPADGPPAFHRDVPLPESPDGVPDTAELLDGASEREQKYYALALRVAAFQKKISHAYEAPFDLASINAMTFSIWKN